MPLYTTTSQWMAGVFALHPLQHFVLFSLFIFSHFGGCADVSPWDFTLPPCRSYFLANCVTSLVTCLFKSLAHLDVWKFLINYSGYKPFSSFQICKYHLPLRLAFSFLMVAWIFSRVYHYPKLGEEKRRTILCYSIWSRSPFNNFRMKEFIGRITDESIFNTIHWPKYSQTIKRNQIPDS